MLKGPDHVALMEWICAAKIGGDANIGKGIYTHFLDDEGMVRADLTVIRMADRCRVIDGADAGPRDFHYLKRVAEDKGFDVTITDVTEKFITIGIWGPNARATLQKVVEDPAGLEAGAFPFAAIKPIRIGGQDVTAFRISYVGEQGWELHMRYEDGLAVWDALRSTGVMAFGVETYANSRRMEKSLRLQNADLADRIQSAGKRSGSGRRSRKPISAARRSIWNTSARHAPAGDALHAGDDRQHRCERRGALSGRQHAGDRPAIPARCWSTSWAAAPLQPRSPSARQSARTSRSPICRMPTPKRAASCWLSISPRPIRWKLPVSVMRHFMTRRI
jgi:hypothetical protein